MDFVRQDQIFEMLVKDEEHVLEYVNQVLVMDTLLVFNYQTILWTVK